MKTILIDENKLDCEIKKLEEKRNEYNKQSSEYVEIDNQIDIINETINKCTIKKQ